MSGETADRPGTAAFSAGGIMTAEAGGASREAENTPLEPGPSVQRLPDTKSDTARTPPARECFAEGCVPTAMYSRVARRGIEHERRPRRIRPPHPGSHRGGHAALRQLPQSLHSGQPPRRARAHARDRAHGYARHVRRRTKWIVFYLRHL